MTLACFAATGCGHHVAGNDGDSTIPVEDLYGTFQVSLHEPMGETPGFATIVGKLNDGPTPEVVIWEDMMVEGDCRPVK